MSHAARLYLKAEEWDAAAVPLRELSFASLDIPSNLFECASPSLIPETAAKGRPWLLVARGQMLQQRAEYLEAGRCFDSAVRLLADAGDKEGLFPTLLRSFFCVFFRGQRKECLGILERCKSLASSNREHTEIILIENNVRISLCRWDEVEKNWTLALGFSDSANRHSVTARIHSMRAKMSCDRGHNKEAVQWAHRALEMRSHLCLPSRALVLNLAADLECEAGHYGEAERHVEEGLRLGRARGYEFVEIAALPTQAAIQLGRWEYRDAYAKIKRALRLAERADDIESMCWDHDILGNICRRNRNPQRALEHHRASLAFVEGCLSELERARALTGIALDLIVMNQKEEGSRTLDEAISISRRLGLLGYLTPALLYRGWLSALSGKEGEAARALGEAVRVANEHDHIYFFSQEAQVATPILALCERYRVGQFVRERIVPSLPARLQSYYEELAHGPIYPTDVPLGSPHPKKRITATIRTVSAEPLGSEVIKGMESLTVREREILKMISQGLPNKVIAAKLFITEKTVKTHANHVFRKLQVSSRLQATLVFQNYSRVYGWEEA
jgi:ATP/maltotriose-dependent transcriptional regulator MalT